MLGECGFYQPLVASRVCGGKRVFKDLIQLAVFDLGWNVLALKQLLGGRPFLWIVLQKPFEHDRFFSEALVVKLSRKNDSFLKLNEKTNGLIYYCT